MTTEQQTPLEYLAFVIDELVTRQLAENFKPMDIKEIGELAVRLDAVRQDIEDHYVHASVGGAVPTGAQGVRLATLMRNFKASRADVAVGTMALPEDMLAFTLYERGRDKPTLVGGIEPNGRAHT